MVVELDGRLFHDAATGRDRDLERDLDTATDGRSTVRLGWGQVFERPCTTAAKVGRLLQLAGLVGGGSPVRGGMHFIGEHPRHLVTGMFPADDR